MLIRITGKKRDNILALFYVVAIQFRLHRQLSGRNNQISPLSAAKIKQFFTKPKIGVTFDGQNYKLLEE
jgi:hypothetical protein